MSFDVAADAYDRLMGRYSALLSPQLADFAGVSSGQRVVDVGCGPGALTTELVMRLGPSRVYAVDPSEPFVAAARLCHPDVSVQAASAEDLPFPDRTFDAALAQLVVHFMVDPVAGLTEMRRVTRPDGVVAACVWDHSGQSPLSPFWDVARALDPTVEGESLLVGTRPGELTRLFASAGLREIEETALRVSVDHRSFDEWWEPFTLGVGPVGAYLDGLDADRRARLRAHSRTVLSDGPFRITGRAWAARGLA